MGLETGTYISDLNVAYPTATDPKSQGDDHIRLLKAVIKATFPNLTGEVTPTQAELNFVDGVTSALQTQLNTLTSEKSIKAGDTYSGTHDFTGAVLTALTQALGDSSTKVATTAFVAGLAFSAELPAQAGNSGKYITTDGTNASWGTITIPVEVPVVSVEAGTLVTAVAGNHYILTNVAATTVNLPTISGLTAGDMIWITVANGLTTNVITPDGTDQINGLNESMTLDNAYATVQLRLIDSTRDWRVL